MHESEGTNFSLLSQFILPQNIMSILRNWGYFWQIESVYPLLSAETLEGHIEINHFAEIINVLTNKKYLTLLQDYSLETVVGFFVTAYLHLKAQDNLELADKYKK